MLIKKEVTINDQAFIVSEITIGDMLPILPRLQDKATQQDAQLEMMEQCIYEDGAKEPIGKGILELGLATYMELALEVMVVNGLDSEDEEGKA